MMAFKANPAISAGAGSLKPACGQADFFPLRVFYPSHSRLKRGRKNTAGFGGGSRHMTRCFKHR